MKKVGYRTPRALAAWMAVAMLICSSSMRCKGPRDRQFECVIAEGDDPSFLLEIGCEDDFQALASAPLVTSIPGARSVKTVIDLHDADRIYYQDGGRYPMHWDFASEHLSGSGLPLVPVQDVFNTTEYYSPDRRFLLGSLTRYEGPGLWVYEIAPWDTADTGMIRQAVESVRASSFLENDLVFHPTSEQVMAEAEDLPRSIEVVTTEQIYEGMDYQPLNSGETVGVLRLMHDWEVVAGSVGVRDIVVLDGLPPSISVVAGIITETFQTPLSHLNVLSQSRGTPNMALRGAHDDSLLQSLQGRWVKLTVGPLEWSIEEVDTEEADRWWAENGPVPATIPTPDLSVTDLRDVRGVLDGSLPLGEALESAIPAFGAKASHYAALAGIGDDVPVPDGFVVPLSYYFTFMNDNGLMEVASSMIEDAEFQTDQAVREARLGQLRSLIESTPVDPDLESALESRIRAEFPGTRMRFRSSTNAEDLEGFTGAGLYSSASGDPDDPTRPVDDAVREVWASVWTLEAFEERSWRGLDHLSVGMALLVHRSFPDEEANGVALTANPFDASGLEPGFYVNVQVGETSVVQPPAGVIADQFVYHHDLPGRPVVYISRSSLTGEGIDVLDAEQIFDLGEALAAIHALFDPVYGQEPGAWFAMDVEFKFDGEAGETPLLWVKQARPNPGFGN